MSVLAMSARTRNGVLSVCDITVHCLQSSLIPLSAPDAELAVAGEIIHSVSHFFTLMTTPFVSFLYTNDHSVLSLDG